MSGFVVEGLKKKHDELLLHPDIFIKDENTRYIVAAMLVNAELISRELLEIRTVITYTQAKEKKE